MPLPRKSHLSFARRLLPSLAAPALTLVLAGPAIANDAPVVTNGTVTPATVPYLGGNVTVTADVTDDTTPQPFVYVQVLRGPIHWEVALSQDGGGSAYSGTVELPANLTSDPVTWQFYVFARDFDNVEGRAFAGESQVAAAPAVDDPPVVSDPSVSPRNLPSAGGPVTLAVSASDLFGVSQAYATITAPGGATSAVVLESVGGGRYQSVFAAPANALPDPLQYAVTMTALDGRAQPTTVAAGTFTVAGRTGRLELKRDVLSFGAVKVGSSGQKTLVMKNDGAKVTRPVSGVLTTSGAPFKVVGAGPSGLPFTLAPGNSMTIKLEYKPAAVGSRTGMLSVTRSDLEQTPIQIPLSGRGT